MAPVYSLVFHCLVISNETGILTFRGFFIGKKKELKSVRVHFAYGKNAITYEILDQSG